MGDETKSKVRTQDRQLNERIADEFRRNSSQVLRDLSSYIIESAKSSLVDVLPARLSKEIYLLTRADSIKVEEKIQKSFLERQVGLAGLSGIARKEICQIAIKNTSKKYSLHLKECGVDPVQYFEKFYASNFAECQLPLNSVSVIDPNLHFHLRSDHLFPLASEALQRAYHSIARHNISALDYAPSDYASNGKLKCA